MGGKSRSRIAALAIPVVAAWVAGLVFAYGGTDFSLDDAWIHLSYAQSLKLDEGLSYNPNDWETGFSSPLWVLLLAAFPWFGSPVVVTKALGIFLHGLAAGLASLCAITLSDQDKTTAERGGDPVHAGLFAGLLVALHPGLLQSSVSGMEVSLAVALLLALVWCVIEPKESRAAFWTAACLAGACVLARPEHLYFVVTLGVALAVQRRDWKALAPALGGIGGMSAWVLYCFAVSGYPLPNSHYVKSAVAGLGSLQYLAVDVLLKEPWVLSVVGLLLMVQALRLERKGAKRVMFALFFAWALALVATAATRHVRPGVLFFHSRYFVVFATVPLVVLATPLSIAPKRWLYGAALLVLLVHAAFLPSRHARVRAQERNTRTLHTQPALAAGRELPADSVVLVEGAGANRFFTPRGMWIVDSMGLNDARIAHSRDSIERICHIYAREPTHLLLPDELMKGLSPAFVFDVLQKFEDPAYMQTKQTVPRSVWLCQIHGPRRDIARKCLQ